VQYETHRIWTKKKNVSTSNVKYLLGKYRKKNFLCDRKTAASPALTCLVSAAAAVGDNIFLP
jgi:hypothetical protein